VDFWYNIAMQKELNILTGKQRSFVFAYVKCNNGTQSAKEAGYKGNEKQLSVIAAQNLGKLRVKDAIQALEKPALEKAQVSTEKVILELKAIAFAPENKVPWNSKMSALRMLGDHLGMWADNKKDYRV
jgi:hypothetical protein